MKILHCCLACFYIDNYSYQENILPRYHKAMGHDVRIIASTETFDDKGNITYCEPGIYQNEDDIRVCRLSYEKYVPLKVARKIRKYIGVNIELEEFSPDLIFLHDVQFLDINIIREYARKNKVRIVADCHADFSNSARSFISRYILHGLIYKHCAKMIEPYTEMFYGVLPARVDFLRDIYGIPIEKTDLLVMGAEDNKAIAATETATVMALRGKYGIKKDDFLIVTGGKIDNFKRQTLFLMDAVNEIDNASVRLIVFGTIIPELESEVKSRVSEKVQYIGWLNSDDTYSHFGMADLVCFPGRHSVFWEQVVGIGIPMLVKYWEGTTHVDCGGNVRFLTTDSIKEIRKTILEIMSNKVYLEMKEKAKNCQKKFMYSEIAKKCIENTENI